MGQFIQRLKPSRLSCPNSVRLDILSPDGKQKQVDIMAKIKQGKILKDLTNSMDRYDLIREAEAAAEYNKHRYVAKDNDVFIWKMHRFNLDNEEIDEMMSKVRKHKSLILDLRGNPGGYVKTLERFVGHFFDHDINIAERKGRKEMETMKAKTRGKDIFKGDLIVLVDSKSASAAELFSRLIQLEKRGTVIGDVTSGAVMQSRVYPHEIGTDIVIFYGISITNADVIMSDGKSLEHVEVAPDKLMIPTPQEMAAGKDPVLSYAASLVGMKLDPIEAGKMFPQEWRKD
jgi:C-terminal processing protease CtpA/Prc